MPSQTSTAAKYWILTIPQNHFTPYLPDACVYVGGQLEQGEETQYLHWQLLVVMRSRIRRGGVKQVFGPQTHCEPTRSAAANEYVFKEATRIDGTAFRLGRFPINRNASKDWDEIRENAKSGNFDAIPSDVFIRCYSSIKNIAKDHLAPVAIERTVSVFWGKTGTGKSRLAWQLAGISAYPKDPMTKFWDGYRNQKNVVIDEFRGDISISHLLRWFDRYPVIIEAKHGATVLCAEHIWVTSNLNPLLWYPNLDVETKAALLRRLDVRDFE